MKLFEQYWLLTSLALLTLASQACASAPAVDARPTRSPTSVEQPSRLAHPCDDRGLPSHLTEWLLPDPLRGVRAHELAALSAVLDDEPGRVDYFLGDRRFDLLVEAAELEVGLATDAYFRSVCRGGSVALSYFFAIERYREALLFDQPLREAGYDVEAAIELLQQEERRALARQASFVPRSDEQGQ